MHDDDLEAAIGAGIVTQAQADALLAFAASRRRSAAALRADEERFRFMRGFNDFFFAIGVLLVGGGISIFLGLSNAAILYAIAAAAMWALAELLVRRMRLVLPGMVILIFFVAFVVSALPLAELVPGHLPVQSSWDSLGLASLIARAGPLQVAIKSAIAGVAAAAFYARFRFPFALFVAGAGAVLAVVMSVSHLLFADAAYPRTVMILLCGLVAFAAAVRFDMSDRLRRTRRSDCAFWLHVLAAPLLVHSLVRLVSPYGLWLDTFAAVMIVVITALLTVVAVIIDRRALLVSALAYIGSVIAFALGQAGADRVSIGIATLVILGVLVLTLGIGWAPLRRAITSSLSSKVMDRLPPVVPA